MPRFSYASDIHLGFYADAQLPVFDWHAEAKILLLAGDIMDGVKPLYIDWVLKTCEGRQGLMTLGNHELYGTRRDKAIRELRSAFRGTHVRLLLNDSVVIDGVRIAATDLWTDFCLQGDAEVAGRAAEHAMSDYRRIKVKDSSSGFSRYRRLRAADTRSWHSEGRRFIRDILNSSEEPVVLMTHHAPSMRSVPEHYQKDLLSAAYASDLNEEYQSARRPPVVNVHGHIHNRVHYQMPCRTWVCANPHGYAGIEDSSGFNAKSSFAVDRKGAVYFD